MLTGKPLDVTFEPPCGNDMTTEKSADPTAPVTTVAVSDEAKQALIEPLRQAFPELEGQELQGILTVVEQTHFPNGRKRTVPPAP